MYYEISSIYSYNVANVIIYVSKTIKAEQLKHMKQKQRISATKEYT